MDQLFRQTIKFNQRLKDCIEDLFQNGESTCSLNNRQIQLMKNCGYSVTQGNYVDESFICRVNRVKKN
jgi:hypothetical protein